MHLSQFCHYFVLNNVLNNGGPRNVGLRNKRGAFSIRPLNEALEPEGPSILMLATYVTCNREELPILNEEYR